jgi:arylsulfatase A-like enzyme
MNAMPLPYFSHLPAVVVCGLLAMGLACGGLDTACHGMGESVPSSESPDRPDTGGPSGTRGGSKASQPPNVLLIGVDTLRADHVGCLGYVKDTTPTLDRLAREGVLCTRTMSTSGWTLPSVMSVLTALYPNVHQVYTYKNRLPEEVTTLAEILKARGYATAGVVGNPIVHSKNGYSDGFDHYDDFTISLDSGLDLFGNHNETFNDQHLVCTSELVTRTAVQWLAQHDGEPFFLFLFYMDPHYDYLPPAPFDTMFDPDYRGALDGRGIAKEPRHSRRPSDRDLQHLLALYDGEIRYTDTYVAKLLQTLAARRLLENTFVVVFGDHGDEFYEHGKTAHDRTLYHEILHVPCILWWPDQVPAGRRVEALTSLVDILPTMLDYLGLPPEGPVQGASLRPLMEGKVDRLHDTVWAELNTWTHVQAVIGDREKLVRNVGSDTWELYDLPHDPREQTNLYGQSAAAEARLALRAKWEQWSRDNEALSRRLASGTKTPEVPVGELQWQQLKALGYLQ